MDDSNKLNRRDFMKKSAAVLASTAVVTGNSCAQKSGLPNIVLIISDDHGADAAGCYGNPVVKTPHLDNLAEEGVRFSHAFCTTSSCSPSRSVILTGLHNHANGMYGLQHSFHHFMSLQDIRSVSNYLTEGGYRTGRVGKFHLAPEYVYQFETVLSGGAANDMESIGRSPVEMANQCRDFINEKNNRPFFLLYALDDPHRGLPFKSWPDPNPFGNLPEGYPGVTTKKYDPGEVLVPSFLPDIPECRAELAQYYQSTSRFDQGIGRLVEVLKDAGKYQNTVIIYISDNGIAFPGAKTTLYEPGMRLPCIVRTPWQKRKNSVCNAMISWTDITPTILDFAGINPQNLEFHGRSFKSVLEEENPAGWNEIYASHSLHEITMYYPMRVVRGRKFKLIWNIASGLDYPFAWDLMESTTWRGVQQRNLQVYGKRQIDRFLHRPDFEFYDLENDPDEINNLAQDPAYEAVFTEYKEKLRAFQERTSDPWIHKWIYE